MSPLRYVYMYVCVCMCMYVCIYIYIYIYIYIHTHTHTRCVVAAQMLNVLEGETQRYGPKRGEAIDLLCWSYNIRGLCWTHTTLNAVLSVPTLAFSSTFFPTCFWMCESFGSLMLSFTTPLDKSVYKMHAWSSSRVACCLRLRRHWKWESILIFFWQSPDRTAKQFLKTYEMFI